MRENNDNQLWPTPVDGVQEAVRFDAWGWPNADSTAQQWVEMLTYWTAQREQLGGGASRAQRNAVSRNIERWSGQKRKK